VENRQILVKGREMGARFEAAKSATPDARTLDRTKPRRYFTPEDDAVIVRMRKAGSTYLPIGKVLKRSKTSIAARYQEFLNEDNPVARQNHARQTQKLSGPADPHVYTAEDDRQLRRMDSLGTKPKDMAVALGIFPTSSVYNRLIKLKRHSERTESKYPEQWSHAEKQKLRVAIAGSKNVREIAHLFPSRSREHIAQFCKSQDWQVPDRYFGDSRWTSAEDAELLRLKGARVPNARIGAILGRTVHALKTRVARLREETSDA